MYDARNTNARSHNVTITVLLGHSALSTTFFLHWLSIAHCYLLNKFSCVTGNLVTKMTMLLMWLFWRLIFKFWLGIVGVVSSVFTSSSVIYSFKNLFWKNWCKDFVLSILAHFGLATLIQKNYYLFEKETYNSSYKFKNCYISKKDLEKRLQ